MAAVLLVSALAPAASLAAPCTPPVASEVACENTKPGADPDTWYVEDNGAPSIQGYATSMSVNKGGTVDFKIKSATSNYRMDILRLGYYGGDGARLIASNVAHPGPSTQPSCLTDSSSGLIDCGNWSVSGSWTVPSSAVSGVYIAHLVRNDGGGESNIIFVVRDDTASSDIVVQTSDTTWQAYNSYGGNSLYTCSVACPPGNPSTYKSAYKVSYNRPLQTESQSALFTGGEYSLIRFIEANGYDTSYVSGVDVHRRGQLLLNDGLFISSGHDEYWSATQRTSMEAARDAGVNLAFFTGNTGFWKTRWEPSSAGASTPDRTMVSYKDTHFPAQVDPVEWTGTWRDRRFTSENFKPENALTGQSFLVNSGTSRITVPYAFKNIRMWRNTGVTALGPGQSLALAPDTLGYEWDVDADNGFRPAGVFKLSSTTVSGLQVFTDLGSTVDNGATATHNLTMYRAPSGARVFNSGTVQWSWGVDDWNSPAADRNMQQATVNLFADLGAQSQTLLSGLVAAGASTDNAAPSSTINSPPSTVADGSQVTISGTATDAGGGVVGGVEVSTDGGDTWHPATSGTSTWSYTWTAHGNPSATIKSRATDDSGNIETPAQGVSVGVTCPCSIWGPNTTVPTAERDSGDGGAVEVGVKFRTDKFGVISGIRFYKAATNTGTHVGSLWTASGQRLAQVTFSGESASGWQTGNFSQPVEVMPGTTYVASYHAPAGHYSATSEYFYPPPSPGPNGGSIVDSGPLHALRNTGGTTNGVYSYTSASAFPTSSFGATQYWVDVLFTASAVPGNVGAVTATEAGATSARVSWSAPTSGGPTTSYKVTPYNGSTALTPKTVGGSPPATSTTVTGLTTGTTYTFKVQALNPNGSGPESAASNAVTPSGPVAPGPPTAVSAEPATNSARVTWTLTDATGDSPLTGQTVTPYAGAVPGTPVQVGPSATSATVTGLTNGTSYTFRVTSTNAIGTSPPSAPSNTVLPQATIFDLATPTVGDSFDPFPVELGTKFRADFDGTITGIRFYKTAANAGPHVGSLWTAAGVRLAQVLFSGESESGWQSATFSTPVAVTAGTTYIASYHAPGGRYSYTSGGLANGVDNPPLHALSGNTVGNAVYTYGPSGSFPTSTWNTANYYVDVTYAMPAPGQPTGVAATAIGANSAKVTWSAPAGGGPVSSYRITPFVGSVAQTPVTAPGTATSKSIAGLTTGTTYRFSVQAVNPNGAGLQSALSNAVTPTGPVPPTAPTGVSAEPASKSARVTWTASDADGDSPVTGQTVTPFAGGQAGTPLQVGPSATSATVTGLDNGTAYTFRVSATNNIGTSAASAPSSAVTPQATILDFATPSTLDAGDTSSVELGVKFQTDFEGSVTGIRFYKAAGNTGTHTGSLWTAGGTRLAQVTFTGETASGWQYASFSNPVAITPNTTYVASYFAPNGHYSTTPNGLASGIDNPPLHALAGNSTENGVYGYASSSTFPSQSFNRTNYSVDVLFTPAAKPGAVTGVSATAGPASADVSWTAPTTGGPPTSYKVTPYIGATPQTAKTVTGSPLATSTTVSGLTPNTAYTFRVEAANPSGTGPASAPSDPVTPTRATPSAPTGVLARPATSSARVSWTAPSSVGESPITSYTVTPYVGSEAQTPVQVGASTTATTVTGLTNGTTYTFRVAATSDAGTGPGSVPSADVIPRATIFDFGAPGTIDSGDGSSVVLGVKFSSDVDGRITGVRFHKAAANTGVHIGSLWTAGGQLLAQGTFTNESPSGWQTLILTNAVTITANTTYVAAYHTPNGHYSVNGGAFSSSGVSNPPLRALANVASPNGVYRYSGSSVFPDNTFNAANYWVDVLFAPGS